MKELIAIILSFFLIHFNAQELNCQVQVIAPTLQSNPANQEIIESLQSSIFEFVSDRILEPLALDCGTRFFIQNLVQNRTDVEIFKKLKIQLLFESFFGRNCHKTILEPHCDSGFSPNSFS